MKEDIVHIIRKFQTLFSITMFFLVVIMCWISTDFSITEIQLSYWSNVEGLSMMWNGILIILGLSTWLNQWIWIRRHRRLTNKIFPKIGFSAVSLFLILTGMFNIDFKVLHNIFAFSYFLGYPFVIFLTAYINRKTILFKHWTYMKVISISMVVVPLSIIPIWIGMAPSELVHSIIVMWWNLWILTKGSGKLR